MLKGREEKETHRLSSVYELSMAKTFTYVTEFSPQLCRLLCSVYMLIGKETCSAPQSS